MQTRAKNTAPANALGATDPGDKLAMELIEAIRSGTLPPGHRISPMQVLAKQYKTTVGVVRGVFEDLQRQGLVKMRQGSGTYVAPHPKKRNTADKIRQDSADPTASATQQVVGLELGFQEHVYGLIAHDLAEALHEHHVHTVNLPSPMRLSNEPLRRWMANPKAPKLTAFITQHSSPEVWERNSFIPTTVRRIVLSLMGTPELPMGWHSVGVDAQAAGRIAVDYLLQRGHRRIGLTTHARSIQPSVPETLRKRTFGHTSWIIAVGHALREHGLHQALSIHYGPSHDDTDPAQATDASPTSEACLRRTEAWLSKPGRPTAVVGVDFYLYAVKLAATRMGLRIPEDLELLGLGNTPYSRVCNFSSLSYDEPEIARQIAGLVLADENQLGRTSWNLLVPPKLVVREA